ncbi:hypothetical protein KR054_002483 [Drosophila jambulina]|nr:hypothetical protein KR054_002483 [Drosophila jambulina]
MCFSCVLATLCCLSSTGTAGVIDRDRQRLQELQAMSERNSNPDAQVGITFEAVEIYKKYRGQEKSDSAKETELNSQVAEFESKIELVEGVPKQGGAFTDFFKKMIKNDLQKKQDSNAHAIVEKVTKYLLGKLLEKLSS